jgi:hypothetical protein
MGELPLPPGHPRDRYSATDVRWHVERQDTSSPVWRRLLALVDEAAAEGRELFRPLTEFSPRERREIVTLPSTVARLTAVKHLDVAGSNLVRIPPEIGALANLETFTPYGSYRLHWFPYELTRCRKLKDSTVSTRALYGNYKFRPPFPRLQRAGATTSDLESDDLDPGTWGADAIRTCSVCDRPIDRANVYQVWISLVAATDVLPLLVNACSPACVKKLPTPADGYVKVPHTGGPDVAQPPDEGYFVDQMRRRRAGRVPNSANRMADQSE